jgi:tagatose 1,6-diphosphate aldolase
MVRISQEKFDRMETLSDENGVIKAAAMDQRGSLFSRLSDEYDIPKEDVTNQMMEEFKEAVSEKLTPYSSAILLDPEWGQPGMKARDDGTGLVVSYERSSSNRRYGDVYTYSLPAGTKQLMPDWTVRKTKELGGDAVKLLINYHPDEKDRWLEQKEGLVERVGAECEHHGLPLFLEFLGYGLDGGDWKNDPKLAEEKPYVVTESIKEFSKKKYNVDVLKVEIPVNMKFVRGTDAFEGEEVYDKQEALEHFRTAAVAAELPMIYLSAGVDAPQMRESLRLANDTGADWNGVLCGRATWQDGISEYADHGVDALREWLEDGGVDNITRMNEIIDEGARTWYNAYGGRGNIEVFD